MTENMWIALGIGAVSLAVAAWVLFTELDDDDDDFGMGV